MNMTDNNILSVFRSQSKFNLFPHVMKDYQLYRQITRIILQLAEELHISTKRAMLIFYNSTVGQQLHDSQYGYQLMSDTYIVNDIKSELANS